jgi:hypothetical protein
VIRCEPRYAPLFPACVQHQVHPWNSDKIKCSGRQRSSRSAIFARASSIHSQTCGATWDHNYSVGSSSTLEHRRSLRAVSLLYENPYLLRRYFYQSMQGQRVFTLCFNNTHGFGGNYTSIYRMSRCDYHCPLPCLSCFEYPFSPHESTIAYETQS